VVGVLECTRNPENSHAASERAAFASAHVVPGISFSPDKVLQARLPAHKTPKFRAGKRLREAIKALQRPC